MVDYAMKIRAKFLTSVLFLVFLAFLIISIIFSVTQQNVNKKLQESETADELFINMFELNLLANDYLRYREERALFQWEAKYVTIGRLLQKEELNDRPGQAITTIRQNHEDLGITFDKLTEIPDSGSKELENRLIGQLTIHSQEMVKNIFLFIESTHTELISIIQKAGLTILSIIIILTFFALITLFFFSKNISTSVQKLQRATTEIEKGNFDTRVTLKTKDEFEQLGDSFNKTAQALAKIDEEHKQLEKSKTDFLSITSHELRSPMTPMKAQLQMLLGGYFGKITKKQKESIDIVLRNTTRLDDVIKDFLEISRIEAARLKFRFVKTNLVTPIYKLIEEMKMFLQEKNISIETTVGKLPIIEIDPDRVMQVLRNLLNNAKKFTPKNGKIFVSVIVQHGELLFTVKDTGKGIDPKNQMRIFEPFFQEEQTMYRKYSGTGLGLAICKGIVASQKGRIWLESAFGKGTTFFFTFPLKPVRTVLPIKLLFSQKESIVERVKKTFLTYLGPIGELELARFGGRFSAQDIILEINDLQKKGILGVTEANKFRDSIIATFN